MACGLTNDQKAMIDKFDSLMNAGGPLGVINALDLPIPTTGAGIAEAAGLSAEYAKLTSAMTQIEGILSGQIPLADIELPASLDSLHNDVRAFADKIKPIVAKAGVAALSVQDLKNEVDRLKGKWGSVNFGDIDIEQIPDLLKDGSLDLDSICKKLPNFQNDGLNVVLKGLPISFPKINPNSILKGLPIPEIPKPQITIEVSRRKGDAAEQYTNVTPPSLYTISSEQTQALLDIAEANRQRIAAEAAAEQESNEIPADTGG